MLCCLFMTAAAKGRDYSDELRRLDAVLAQKSIYDQYLLDRSGMLKSMLEGQDSPYRT